MKTFKTSLLAAAVALTLGVSSVGAQETATTERTVGQAVDDATITASVKAMLLADDRAEGFDINVDTRKGTVTLTGGADTMADKLAAGRIASGAEGVVLVNNEITVAAEGTAKRIGANTATASGEVRAAVAGMGDMGDDDRTAMDYDKTRMDHDKAEMNHDKAAMNHDAANVRADAHMRTDDDDTVADSMDTAGDVIDDSWITSKVKTQLLADAAVAGTQISVETTGNVVTLTGTAASAAARTKAIEIAQATEGVRSVVATQLTIGQ